MSLFFVKYKKPGPDTVIQKLIEEIQSNLILLRYISRIFATHSLRDETNLIKIEEFISDTLNSPALSLRVEKRNGIIELVKEIYKSSNFESIRSEILEYICLKFGPFIIIDHSTYVFLEPQILDNGVVIGNSHHRCDIVFYDTENTPLEIIECKTNINNFIPSYLPFEGAKKKVKEKIKYMGNVYSYLKGKYCEPIMFIVCYNTDYQKAQKNLAENWGYPFIKCIGPEDILRFCKHKKAKKQEVVSSYID